jgi:protein O-mannosyl-transferase
MTVRDRGWWLPMVAVAALALVASANSIVNGFTYDDVALIQNAERVHGLREWWREFGRTYWPEGDGYRPLTVIGWRIQWMLGGGSPQFYHVANVVMHIATSAAVLWLCGAIMPAAAASIAAALYAVHPVHVEAIANVVGQSELAVALLIVVAVGLYVRARSSGTPDAARWAARSSGTPDAARWAAIAALFAIACFFKEHAIVLPFLLVLAELTVLRAGAPRTALARVRPGLLVLALIAAGYFFARSRVVIDGLAGFRPFIVFESLSLSTTDRVLTMIGVSPEWLRLLLWPARLSTQYAPPAIDVAQGVSVSLLPGLLVLAGVIGLVVVCWKRSPAASFGLGWVIVTLLPSSNFVVPAGFIIAERTLVLPSVGAMIALGTAAWAAWQRVSPRPAIRQAGVGLFGVVLALGIARSVTRNAVWHDDDRLWRQGVIDAPDSYLAHFRLGLHLFSIGDYHGGEAHYRRAIDLFPHDPLMAYSFAEQLRGAGQCRAAMPIYQWLFTAWPESRRGHIGYAACLLGERRYDDARREALVWIDRGGRLPLARQVLAAAKAGRDSAAARQMGTRR